MPSSSLRTLSLTALLLPSIALPAIAQKRSAKLEADISYLASDRLQGRGIGSAGADSAAEYIAKRFKELGLKQAPSLRGWFQSFTVSPDAPAVKGTDLGGMTGRNVVGMLPGQRRGPGGPVHRHRRALRPSGLGWQRQPRPGQPRGGCTTAPTTTPPGSWPLLDIARRLALHPAGAKCPLHRLQRRGGGPARVRGLRQERRRCRCDSVVAMLNFDMVGRLPDDKLVVYGVETAREWRPLLDSLNADGAVRAGRAG